MMLFVTVAVVTLMVVTTVAICAALGSLWHDEIVRARPGRCAPEAAARPAEVRASRPESLEGVLAGQLLVGKISQRQYLNALAGIAARDEGRHPLAVPPELGPSGV